jgi:hypothetical protein
MATNSCAPKSQYPRLSCLRAMTPATMRGTCRRTIPASSTSRTSAPQVPPRELWCEHGLGRLHRCFAGATQSLSAKRMKAATIEVTSSGVLMLSNRIWSPQVAVEVRSGRPDGEGRGLSPATTASSFGLVLGSIASRSFLDQAQGAVNTWRCIARGQRRATQVCE